MWVWDGDPIAFTIGAISMRWYGLLFAGGFVLGYGMMIAMFKRARYDTNDLDKLLLYVFLGTLIGARLGHCLIYEPGFYLSHPLEILMVWHGGLASHGGTVGVILAFAIFIYRSHKYKFFEIADLISIPIALVCTFIRIGNFMNSEILGKPTLGYFGVVFARLGETYPRYPAQLFEAAAYFITFLILAILYFTWKKQRQGVMLAVLLLCIYTSRFFIEPFKEEQADYSTEMWLNVGQLLSIPFIIGSLLLLIWRWRRNDTVCGYELLQAKVAATGAHAAAHGKEHVAANVEANVRANLEAHADAKRKTSVKPKIVSASDTTNPDSSATDSQDTSFQK